MTEKMNSNKDVYEAKIDSLTTQNQQMKQQIDMMKETLDQTQSNMNSMNENYEQKIKNSEDTIQLLLKYVKNISRTYKTITISIK